MDKSPNENRLKTEINSTVLTLAMRALVFSSLHVGQSKEDLKKQLDIFASLLNMQLFDTINTSFALITSKSDLADIASAIAKAFVISMDGGEKLSDMEAIIQFQKVKPPVPDILFNRIYENSKEAFDLHVATNKMKSFTQKPEKDDN